tara:strand:- start:6653 stop:6835 length:183 start_codon:yes stop_codon:yes gene_type:complete
MQFQKKRAGNLGGVGKILIKFLLVILVFFVAVILIDRIEFPSPKKNIEKILKNENFKVVK